MAALVRREPLDERRESFHECPPPGVAPGGSILLLFPQAATIFPSSTWFSARSRLRAVWINAMWVNACG